MAISQLISDSWKRYGAVNTAILVNLTLLERLLFMHKLEILTLDSGALDEKFRTIPDMFEGGFLNRDTLLKLSENDPELELHADFINSALSKGDRCYAIRKGDEVVSYGWYSREPTSISGDLLFSFDPAYVYMYKGYTKPEYRGFRLHGIGMSAALLAYEAEGCAGIVSYVKRSNLASLRSVYRMGYKKIGSIVFIGRQHRIMWWRTPGCRFANVSLIQDHGIQAVEQPYSF